jgi:hypothetical protein
MAHMLGGPIKCRMTWNGSNIGQSNQLQVKSIQDRLNSLHIGGAKQVQVGLIEYMLN